MPETDMTSCFENLRGDEYIEAIRALALIADARNGKLSCASCKNPAEYIGMQRCGEPGGPICTQCVEHHRQWVETAVTIAEASPYCRHCDADVDKTHLYMVGLWDGVEYDL